MPIVPRPVRWTLLGAVSLVARVGPRRTGEAGEGRRGAGKGHNEQASPFEGARLLRANLRSPTVAEVLTGRERGRW